MTARTPPTASNAPTTAADALRELYARQEAERRHVARALHNEIGQALSAIKMSAHLAGDEDDAAQRGQDLADIVRIADDTVARLRDLYADLRPPQIDTLGLAASLRGEADRWRARWGVTPQLALTDPSPRARADIELAAFRLVQDLLLPLDSLSTLVVRLAPTHAGQAVLEVHHDGAPADALTTALLQSRAQAVGLSLDLAATPGQPRLRLALPATAED
ncbi:sensor histidine kinase [Pseudoxanthomonas beigongshangi]|jgi:glucose-6-phosphate-specific signal transduction histidine kinase